jgi:hypothetical protein
MWLSALHDEYIDDFIYVDNLLEFAFWLKRVRLAAKPSTLNPLIVERTISEADELLKLCKEYAREFTVSFTGVKAVLIELRFDSIDDDQDFSLSRANARLRWLEPRDPEAVYLRVMNIVNGVTLALHYKPIEYFAEVANIFQIKRGLQHADFEATLSLLQLTQEHKNIALKLNGFSELATKEFVKLQSENWYFLMKEMKRLIVSLNAMTAEKEDKARVALGESSVFSAGHKGFGRDYERCYSRLIWLQVQRCRDLKELLELQEFRTPLG